MRWFPTSFLILTALASACAHGSTLSSDGPSSRAACRQRAGAFGFGPGADFSAVRPHGATAEAQYNRALSAPPYLASSAFQQSVRYALGTQSERVQIPNRSIFLDRRERERRACR